MQVGIQTTIFQLQASFRQYGRKQLSAVPRYKPSMAEPSLTIASLIRDPSIGQVCSRWLKGGRCHMVWVDPSSNPVAELERRREEFDALLLEQGAVGPSVYQSLSDLGLVLPAVVIGAGTGEVEFHDAEVHLPTNQLEQLSYSLDAAVSRFLRRGGVGAGDVSADQLAPGGETPDRWKLANRLQGRLGLLGVFYKRDSSRFLRNLSVADRDALLQSLERTYRDLLLSYFRDPSAANQALESFVNTAFFSDLPITKAVEIHMNLIDGFAKQLKLEGNQNDFLQDYRLALLDVMAHLCEMYRRSVPPDGSAAS
jgi:circadian clock protein KaiA